MPFSRQQRSDVGTLLASGRAVVSRFHSDAGGDLPVQPERAKAGLADLSAFIQFPC